MTLSQASHGDARLPTPPREEPDNLDVYRVVDDALEYLEASLSSSIQENQPTTRNSHRSRPNTPPSSSPIQGKPVYENPLDERPKCLRFSAETSFCDATAKPLLPSRLRHPTKSILKPVESPLSSSPTARDPLTSIVFTKNTDQSSTMLEFALKALGGQDLITRRDAWSSLWTSMKTFQDFPSNESLRENLAVLETFLRRDISDHIDTLEPSAKQLKLQALQFAHLFSWKCPPSKGISSSFSVTNEFATILIDHSIQAIASDSVSKDLLRNYLAILTSLQIYAWVFTADKALKCVKALNSIPERLTGKSILQSRLIFFSQLATNHPRVAVETVSEIFPHLVQGLCSKFAPTRSRALESALNFATCVGRRPKVSQAVWNWLQQRDATNNLYFRNIETMLRGLLSAHNRQDSRHEQHHAPQIWSVLILLVQGDQEILYRCLMRQSWTKIILVCFDSTDMALNLHAWTAWNRTIFAARHLLHSHTRILEMLCLPIFSCLQRATDNEDRLRVKCEIHQSSRLILYYTFTRNLPADRIKVAWQIIIGGICRNILKDEVDDLYRFAHTLGSLLSDSTLKISRTRRALEVDEEPLDATEIPKLESSWIRSNVTLILRTLEPLLRHHGHSQHFIIFMKPVWISLMKGISQAGEKEIKASEALMNAIAGLLNFLRGLWTMTEAKSESQSGIPSIPTATVTALLKIAVNTIGPLHWGEDVLVQTSNGLWEAANTPSKQALSRSEVCQRGSPIASIFALLSHPPSDSMITPTLRVDISHILQSCLISRPTLSSKLNLLLNCSKSLPLYMSAEQRPIVPILWQCIMEQMSLNLSNPQDADCCNILYILSSGLRFSDKKSLEIGRNVFTKLSALVYRERGEAGFVSLIGYPWVEIICEDEDGHHCKNATLRYFSSLVECSQPVHHPKSSQIGGKSGRSSNELYLNKAVLWPDRLYTGIGTILASSYSKSALLDLHAVHDFLLVLRNFLARERKLWSQLALDPKCPLLHFQSGLLLWLRDEANVIPTSLDRGFDLGRPVRDIFESMFQYLTANLPLHNGQLPKCFNDLFLGSFRSRRKATVNLAIIAWNAAIERCEDIEYSLQLSFTLDRLSKYTDVQLSSNHRANGQIPSDIDLPSEDRDLFPWVNCDIDEGSVPTPLLSRKTQPRSSPPRLTMLSFCSPTSKLVTPSPSPNDAHQQRCSRHDDSHLQFLPIEPSPSRNTEENGESELDHNLTASNNTEIFVDASSHADLQSDRNNKPGNSDYDAERADASPSSSLGKPLKDISPNPANGLSISDAKIIGDMHSPDSVDCIEDSFPLAKGSSSLRPASEAESFSKNSHERSFNKMSVIKPLRTCEEPTGRDTTRSPSPQPYSDVIPSSRATEKELAINGCLASTNSEARVCEVVQTGSQKGVPKQHSETEPSQASQRRSSRRRNVLSTYKSTCRMVESELSLLQEEKANPSQLSTYADDSDEVIDVEAPDSNSPSLRTVLERLGILIGDDSAPSARRTPSASQRSASKRKRSSSLDSKQAVRNVSVEGQRPGKKPRTRKSVSSQNVAAERSQHSSPLSAPSRRNSKETAALVSLEDVQSVKGRLRSLIGDISGLKFGSDDDAAKTELLELGTQLQNEIRTVIGIE